MKALICGTCKREYKTQEDFLRDTSRWRFCFEGNLWFDCSCRSSNMLLKGEYEWFSIEDVMDEKIATIFSDISETKDLPSIPSSVMKLQHLLSNKKTSAKDIECELKNLPAIAMRTIAIANNLKISSSPKITSLQHAISFLGFETISELLLIASLRSFIF